MDYSKVDWSRCKLPDNGKKANVSTSVYGAIVVHLDNRLIASRAMEPKWHFFADNTPRDAIDWALKAADAVDAFLVEEQKRAALESQSWLTPKELLRELCERESILVKTSRGQNWELRLTGNIQRRNVLAGPGVPFEFVPFEWFACQRYRKLVPPSQPDTPRVEKKWKESLVVTGEHKLVALDHEPNSVRLSLTVRNPITGANSSFPKPGQRVRLTLEVEEDAPRFETGADVGFTLRIEGP